MKDLDRRVNLQNGLQCNLTSCNWKPEKLIVRGYCKGRMLDWSDTGRCQNYSDHSHDITSFVYSRHREITEKDIGRNVILYDGRIATITEWDAKRSWEMKGICDGKSITWFPCEHLWVAALRGDCSASTREYGIASFIEDPPPPTGTYPMSIPYSQFRDAPATAAVNAEFKAREDALHQEYMAAVMAVHMACQHNWGAWEHRTKQCCTGSFQRYERSCTLCGCMTAQEEKPETDQPIKETSDSFIDAY